jgi:hypothetical protein
MENENFNNTYTPEEPNYGGNNSGYAGGFDLPTDFSDYASKHYDDTPSEEEAPETGVSRQGNVVEASKSVTAHNDAELEAIISSRKDRNEEANIHKLQISDIYNRLSGEDRDGFAKASLSYLFYSYDENGNESIEANNVIPLPDSTTIDIKMNFDIPNMTMCDVKFKDYTDPALAALWHKLEQFGNKCKTEPEKTWIFQFHMVEASALYDDVETGDNILIGDAVSPIFWALTRERPSDVPNNEVVAEDEAIYGGNTIRMLFDSNLISFSYQNADEINESKGRAEENLEYMQNSIEEDMQEETEDSENN